MTDHWMVLDRSIDSKQALVAEPWRVRRTHLAALLQPPGRSNALRLSDVADVFAATGPRLRSRGVGTIA